VFLSPRQKRPGAISGKEFAVPFVKICFKTVGGVEEDAVEQVVALEVLKVSAERFKKNE
jgi:hypothetical protein